MRAEYAQFVLVGVHAHEQFSHACAHATMVVAPAKVNPEPKTRPVKA